MICAVASSGPPRTPRRLTVAHSRRRLPTPLPARRIKIERGKRSEPPPLPAEAGMASPRWFMERNLGRKKTGRRDSLPLPVPLMHGLEWVGQARLGKSREFRFAFGGKWGGEDKKCEREERRQSNKIGGGYAVQGKDTLKKAEDVAGIVQVGPGPQPSYCTDRGPRHTAWGGIQPAEGPGQGLIAAIVLRGGGGCLPAASDCLFVWQRVVAWS
ncbi:hypothetical protein C8R47DRAFT_1070621 [Mycena vitilis]|nr:hypothetical protein C8R47DRAFT_1070621 [Mycena vitilis]